MSRRGQTQGRLWLRRNNPVLWHRIRWRTKYIWLINNLKQCRYDPTVSLAALNARHSEINKAKQLAEEE